MNTYVFHNINNTAIRLVWIKENEKGSKSVKDIFETDYDGSKESLKKTVKRMYEWAGIGQNGEHEIFACTEETYKKEYDNSLEGKARKRASKEINVLTEQLYT